MLVQAKKSIRTGRPKTTSTLEIIEQVHGIISEDAGAAVHETAETIGISVERVGHILRVPEELHMKTLFSKNKCRISLVS